MGTGKLLRKPNKLRGNGLRWTSIPSRGSRNTPSRFMLQKPVISSGSYEPVSSKASLHNTCATYHCFIRTLVSFDSAFSSKEGVLFHSTKVFLFSISEGDQEHFSNQLLGQFLQNLSFLSSIDSTSLFPAILGFLLISTNEWHCLT